MKVLVTGGAGYIGSHTIVELLRMGHSPIVLDNFINSSPIALERVTTISGRRFEHVCVNLIEEKRVRQTFEKFNPDVVIHFAGLKAVGESEINPLSYYEQNICSAIQLLKTMDAVGCKKIVFSSSATVYGTPRYLPFDETHPVAPINPYGNTKYFIERMLADWVATDLEKSAVLLRYFNPIGAHHSGMIGDDPRGIPNNLVPFVSQVAVGRRKKLIIFGDDYDTRDGTCVRDYVDVNDLAAGHTAALDYVANHSGIEAFNLGTGNGHTVLEVVNAFSNASGREIPFEIASRRKGDVASSFASTEKARSILRWEAQRSLPDICADIWRWQSGNPNGYCNR